MGTPVVAAFVCGSIRRALVAIGVVCLFHPSLNAQPPAKKDAAKSTQTRIEKKTYDFKEAGKEMEYALFVPSTYDKDKKTLITVPGSGGLSPAANAVEGEYAFAWAKNVWADALT